eukprot:1200344-Amphidinium_carterae.1
MLLYRQQNREGVELNVTLYLESFLTPTVIRATERMQHSERVVREKGAMCSYRRDMIEDLVACVDLKVATRMKSTV